MSTVVISPFLSCEVAEKLAGVYLLTDGLQIRYTNSAYLVLCTRGKHTQLRTHTYAMHHTTFVSANLMDPTFLCFVFPHPSLPPSLLPARVFFR